MYNFLPPEIMDDNNEVIVPQKGLENLKPRHLKFLVQYLKTGNTTDSYMKVYRIKNRATAGSNGSHLLAKYKHIKKLLYEANGLDEKNMIKVIKDALTANKGMKATKYYKDGSIKEEVDSTGPDHFIRLKAVEIRNKSLGEDVSENQRTGNTLNIIIQKDKARGIFSMAEEGEVIE